MMMMMVLMKVVVRRVRVVWVVVVVMEEASCWVVVVVVGEDAATVGSGEDTIAAMLPPAIDNGAKCGRGHERFSSIEVARLPFLRHKRKRPHFAVRPLPNR